GELAGELEREFPTISKGFRVQAGCMYQLGLGVSSKVVSHRRPLSYTVIQMIIANRFGPRPRN
ncbi:MAG: hypothetical protein OEN21_15435, partial [Myxococcales bacterium]|nr:hypothetical protein [Myxococcales bacterium]